MKNLFATVLSLLLVLSLIKTDLFAQLQLQGNNFLEYSVDRETDNKYFEDWTDIYMNYQNWRLGARYEMHLPPQLYSLDTTGQGISQRFMEYRKDNLVVTLGNFYSLFGRGLVLRSFENRMLRWDTNIDGAKFEFHQRYIDFQLLGGRPRDRSGRRHAVLEGGTVNLKPVLFLSFGGSYVTTRLPAEGDVDWGSVHAETNLNWGSFYFERAFKKFPNTYPPGKAYYGMGNVYYGPLTALVEYRDYDQFDLTEGLTYNNPPAVVREHLYTLMNRHQLVQNANDEKGYLAELSYTIGDKGVLTLSNSRTTNHDGLLLYREYYGQLEFDPTYNLNLVGGFGQQRDLAAEYLNFVGTGKLSFKGYNAVKLIVEHQHAKVLLNDRQFYNQAITLSYDRSPLYTLSLLAERTTDQLSEKDIWLGGQVDVHFLENFDLSVFGGKRREGKLCVGGVCIFRPEFEGVELRLINRF